MDEVVGCSSHSEDCFSYSLLPLFASRISLMAIGVARDVFISCKGNDTK